MKVLLTIRPYSCRKYLLGRILTNTPSRILLGAASVRWNQVKHLGNLASKGHKDEALLDVSPLDQLPRNFGTNQHMHIDEELKERLRALLWAFKAPVRYAVAYGSGVFSQGKVSARPPVIDLIFGVTCPRHWHSLNLQQHRDHYSLMGSLGSAAVSFIQDRMGAGVYFNPYVDVNGTVVKYGVLNIDTLCRDLIIWDTLYLAGRFQKPIKVLRDDPRVRLANQINLISALRVALLMLPEKFSEQDLYTTVAGISYLGDPRMRWFAENPHKVKNIVSNQLGNFRRLYSPLIQQLPNVHYISGSVSWSDPPSKTMLKQCMDPIRRGNMVCRLPRAFREKLYSQYRRKFRIPVREFRRLAGGIEDEERVKKKQGGEFDRQIAGDNRIRDEVSKAIKKTISGPSTSQSLKGLITAGPARGLRYLGEKIGKWKQAQKNRLPEHSG